MLPSGQSSGGDYDAGGLSWGTAPGGSSEGATADTSLVLPLRGSGAKDTRLGGGPSCVVVAGGGGGNAGSKDDRKTSKQKKIKIAVIVVTLVLVLTSMILVGVTLSMSGHIDDMGKNGALWGLG